MARIGSRFGSRFGTLVAAAAVSLAVAVAVPVTARAADMPRFDLPDADDKGPKFGEYRSGWYLRGDIGYRHYRIGHVDSVEPITSFTQDGGVAVGGGVGFKHDWFRTDLTIDYGAPAKFKGETQSAAVQPQYLAKIESVAALLNAYVDLGTWAGITPYAGAGIGASRMRTREYQDTALAPGQLVPVRPKWNLAWAAMAGVSVRVAKDWEIDVGYRYLNLGTAYSGKESGGVETAFRNLTAQEVRVGVRFLLD